MIDERNSRGLFDIPVPATQKFIIDMTVADFERQLDEGAFLMSREEAVKQGYLNPAYDPDTVIAAIVEEE